MSPLSVTTKCHHSVHDSFHSPGKLVLTEGENFAPQSSHNEALVLGSSVLQDVLDDIVAVLVLHQALRVLVELLQDGSSLLQRTVLQDALDHSTAVRVSRQCEHLVVTIGNRVRASTYSGLR